MLNTISNEIIFGEIHQDSAILSEEESHHFSKVLRGNEGDKIHVTDGKGNMAECEVVSVSKKAVEAKIIDLKTDFEKKIIIYTLQLRQQKQWNV